MTLLQFLFHPVKSERGSAYKPLIFWGLLLALIVFLHIGHPLNSDEGFILSGAWELFNGREPYVDFFSAIPPGSYYLVYWLWGGFGVSYFSAKLLAIIVLFFCATGIYKISREISQKKDTAYIPPVLFVVSTAPWPIINHHVFSLLFIIWGVFFFLKLLDNDSILWVWAAGLCIGLSSLFLIHKGAFIAFILECYFIFKYRASSQKRLFIRAAMLAMAVIIPFSTLWIYWPVPALFDMLIVFPATRYMTMAIAHTGYSLTLVTILCVVLLGLTYAYKTSKDYKIWLLMVLQYGFLFLSLQFPDYYHITTLMFPMYITLICLGERYYFLQHEPVRIGHYGLAILLMGITTIVKVPHWSQSPLAFHEHPLIDKLKKVCGESNYIYAGPFASGLYFEMRKLNATKYSLLLTELNTNEQFTDAAVDLENRKPACAVMEYEMVKPFNYDKNNPVDNYIQQHYTLRETYGSVEIYTSVGTSTPAQ